MYVKRWGEWCKKMRLDFAHYIAVHWHMLHLKRGEKWEYKCIFWCFLSFLKYSIARWHWRKIQKISSSSDHTVISLIMNKTASGIFKKRFTAQQGLGFKHFIFTVLQCALPPLRPHCGEASCRNSNLRRAIQRQRETLTTTPLHLLTRPPRLLTRKPHLCKGFQSL